MPIVPGSKFGRLTVIGKGRSKGRTATSACKCECGARKDISSADILRGRTRSCGCLLREATGNRMRTHGMSGESEYMIWLQMMSRCGNPRNKKYGLYGGRGISVCDDWKSSFASFIRDVGRRPSPRHSIDRIDGNGNYEAANCRWATTSEQGNNRSSNHRIEFNGKTLNVTQWASELGIPLWKMRDRLRRKKMSISSIIAERDADADHS